MTLFMVLLLATQVDQGTICQAIKNQWEIRAVVREDVVVNSQEIRFITQEVTMKPYEVGTASNGHTILKGEVVKSKDLKEQSLKHVNITEHKGGWFYSSVGLKEFDLNGIEKLEILTHTHFEAPNQKFGEELENVCSLPSKDEVHILK